MPIQFHLVLRLSWCFVVRVRIPLHVVVRSSFSSAMRRFVCLDDTRLLLCLVRVRTLFLAVVRLSVWSVMRRFMRLVVLTQALSTS